MEKASGTEQNGADFLKRFRWNAGNFLLNIVSKVSVLFAKTADSPIKL